MKRLKKICLIAIGILLVIIIIITLWPSEQKRLKYDINALSQAIEKEELKIALNYINPTYQDKNGMDYTTFVQRIEQLFRECDSITVKISGLKVGIDSVNAQKTFFAHCSLGLKVFARYQGDKTLIFGGILKPAPVRAWFKKTKISKYYQVIHAHY